VFSVDSESQGPHGGCQSTVSQVICIWMNVLQPHSHLSRGPPWQKGSADSRGVGVDVTRLNGYIETAFGASPPFRKAFELELELDWLVGRILTGFRESVEFRLFLG
jgi:hypothetical protein